MSANADTGEANGRAFSIAPLGWLAAAFAFGICASHLLSVPLALSVSCSAIFAVAATLLVIKRRFAAASYVVFIAFICCGATAQAVESLVETRNHLRTLYARGEIVSGAPIEVTGTIIRAPEPAVDGFFLTLQLDSVRLRDDEQKVKGRVWLFAPVRDAASLRRYELLELQYGARVRVMARLRREENFRNEGVESTIDALDRRGFDAVGVIKSPLLVERLENESVFVPLAVLYRWRARLIERSNTLFSQNAAAILNASAFGDRYYLSRDTAERFRVGGTMHLLVISGTHISFVGLLVYWLLGFVTKRNAWRFVVAASLVWAYTLMVGAETPVLRAAVMFSFVSAAQLFFRRHSPLNALGAAVLLLLVWRPRDLFDVSFQLTFLAVLALACLAFPAFMKLKQIGEWRPTRATPHPPRCSPIVRAFAETLFWSERSWRANIERENVSYVLQKSRLSVWLDRWRVQLIWRYLCGALLVSFCVQLCLLPLMLTGFHRVSLAGVVLNIWSGFALAFFSFASLAAICVSLVADSLAAPFVAVTEFLARVMLHSVDPFTSLNIAQIRVATNGWASSPIILIYYAACVWLAVVLYVWRPFAVRDEAELFEDANGQGVSRVPHGWRRKLYDLELPHVARSLPVAFAVLLLCACLLVLRPFAPQPGDGRLHVHFLDVGQGDSALIVTPAGTTLLVDGGGRLNFSQTRNAQDRRSIDGTTTDYRETDAGESFERDSKRIGERVVAEYLWEQGFDRIDYLLATHADADHIQGLSDIAHAFPVRAAFVGRAPATSAEFADFRKAIDESRRDIFQVSAGDELRFGDVTIETLSPTRGTSVSGRMVSDNNASVVVRVVYGSRCFLLTGDIERAAEQSLLQTAPDALRCDVVKVAHHGSRTSSTEGFVRAAHPAYAVISVGRESIYGHPHAEVVERWRQSGAQVLTTGERGTISFSTDGRDLQLQTFVRE